MDEHMLTATSLSANYREWNAVWKNGANFYALNLGMCLPFAVGLSLAFPRRKVIALDSDGSLLLDTSSLVTAAAVNPGNLVAIVFDNGVYGRMGATATAHAADLEKIAQGAGIKSTATIRTLEEFERRVKAAMDGAELAFFVVKVEPGKERVDFDHRLTHGRAMKEAFVDAVRRHPDYRANEKKSS
jgi:thiamine pyrophosphate-dependent acetolactate synthase large subunit-like protein